MRRFFSLASLASQNAAKRLQNPQQSLIPLRNPFTLPQLLNDATHCAFGCSNRKLSTAAPSMTTEVPASTTTNEMVNRGVEGRYATALFNVALSSSSLDAVYENLEALNEAIRISPILSTYLLSSPSMVPAESIPELLNVLSKKFLWHNISKNFVDLLFANKRVHTFPGIFTAFQKLYRNQKGLKYCSVTAAAELSPSQQKEVTTAVQNRVGNGFKLIMEFKKSPSILGGLVVLIDDQVLDFSVASRLERMQAVLLEPLQS